jgi:1,4-alpha-glucan branching enzyme
MLTKRQLKNGKVEVTFAMPRLDHVSKLYLVGDFNNWSIAEHPLTCAADGSWSLALELEGGRAYQFRYFGDNEEWFNDWQADAYVPNQFGGDNSVVNVAAPEAAPAPRQRAARAKPAAEGAAAPARKRAAPRKKKTE